MGRQELLAKLEHQVLRELLELRVQSVPPDQQDPRAKLDSLGPRVTRELKARRVSKGPVASRVSSALPGALEHPGSKVTRDLQVRLDHRVRLVVPEHLE